MGKSPRGMRASSTVGEVLEGIVRHNNALGATVDAPLYGEPDAVVYAILRRLTAHLDQKKAQRRRRRRRSRADADRKTSFGKDHEPSHNHSMRTTSLLSSSSSSS